MPDETDAGENIPQNIPGPEDSADRGQKISTLRVVTQDGQRLEAGEGGAGGPAPPSGGDGEAEIPPPFASEISMARVLVGRRLGGDWRFVTGEDEWVQFLDGQCWRRDDVLGISTHVQVVCCAIADRFDDRAATTKRALCSAKAVSAVERLARSCVATPLTDFDVDPWVYNTPGGIVDLRSGACLPHDKNRLCRKIGGAAPEGACPTWRRFLRDVTAGDREYEDYLQRLVGYSLVGSTEEEMFVFIYGPSNTGKSKFVETLRMLHLDYGGGAPMDSFTVARGERHPTDLAGFAGKRLITAAETEEGRRWDQQRLTMLTGRDRIEARFMRGDFFTYFPQFLLCFHGNYRPRLGNADEAMRRRMHLLPFTNKPTHVDKHLINKLQAELGGIMRWAIEGCLLWQRQGLEPPRVVVDATKDYFAFENSLGRWMDERCEFDIDFRGSVRELYVDFQTWMKAAGEWCPREGVFSQKMAAVQGVTRGMLHGGRAAFRGVRLKTGQGELL